jgi:dihydropteroate synthase
VPVYANLAGVEVGDGFPVRLVGAINVSPESFYKPSVAADENALRSLAERMVAEGADLLDIGAMSTAPYLETHISEDEESRRLTWAIRLVRRTVPVPLSADTTRSRVALAAIEAGARIVNDVSGLRGDPATAEVIAASATGAILMASESTANAADPIQEISNLFGESLRRAEAAEIARDRLVVDPGIGFFRRTALPWDQWDCAVLRRLGELGSLGRPILVGVSRKSFIGKILGRQDPVERLPGSLAATVVAVLNGAHLVRTHDVGSTRDAVRMAEALRADR